MDLSRPEGQAAVQRLVPLFDVVLINYRAGVPAKMGIDYATLRPINPRLIYASITGFGESGPYARRAGSDIVAQAYSGLMAAEAKVDDFGAPAPITSTTIIDRSSGLAAAMGICAALYHRERTGEGQEIQVSLLHTALELQSDRVMREPVHDAVLRDPLVNELLEKRAAGAKYDELANIRKAQGPRFASHRLYYGGYHTAEGALVLGALTQQNRDTIRRIIDIHDPTDDRDFNAIAPGSKELVEEWRLRIQERLMQRPAAEWVELFLDAGVPASVVQFAEELADDPQVVATGMMAELEHEATGPQRVVAPIVRMSATPPEAELPAPVLGRHSREVLREAGFSEGEITALVAGTVIGTPDR